MIELNKVTAAIVAASTVLITAFGFLIYRNFKLTQQINSLKTDSISKLNTDISKLKEEISKLADTFQKDITISEKVAKGFTEMKVDKNNQRISKLRKACGKGFDKMQYFFNCIGIDIIKETQEEFYNSNKEKLDLINSLLGNSPATQGNESTARNTKDDDKPPRLNNRRRRN